MAISSFQRFTNAIGYAVDVRHDHVLENVRRRPYRTSGAARAAAFSCTESAGHVNCPRFRAGVSTGDARGPMRRTTCQAVGCPVASICWRCASPLHEYSMRQAIEEASSRTCSRTTRHTSASSRSGSYGPSSSGNSAVEITALKCCASDAGRRRSPHEHCGWRQRRQS